MRHEQAGVGEHLATSLGRSRRHLGHRRSDRAAHRLGLVAEVDVRGPSYAGRGELGVHGERGGQHPCRRGPAVARAGDADHVTDLVPTDRGGRGPREAEVVLAHAGCRAVRRHQPEQCVATGQRPVEDGGICVAPHHHLHVVAHGDVQAGRLTDDDALLLDATLSG